ncbi:gamma-glutamyl-gamma-aminobutyrate hydrolase family protein [Lichenihabitans sp. PAMC28606]|uniref:gamma-glutamyl-gamma-aminobutyrate hydrolase family protein n=1 Tax=Lichenihabitans sp. PAMC28606 TaxID=2880932 RepID=UPI001D0B4E17|nr:gamma-glutamyl-gamma-aminobutyrate hydrolase family protein [Lichenihabitans sp. PAMC28606]UDL94140.1 gamma-glutamyl-gamma-aminobutyrate hydrolase family protein [Lichenihabitans sp. PAMC28606]
MSPRPVPSRPLIGILCCTNTVSNQNAQTVINRYIDAVDRALVGDIVLIPTNSRHGDLASLLGRLDGVVLTGSPSNVEARHYGSDVATGPFDPARDDAALALVHTAASLKTPVLGICRGLQEVNVALGGSLRHGIGDAAGSVAHHAPDQIEGDAMFEWMHPVALRQGGVLQETLHRSTAEVNSVHYQGIERLADALQIEAQAPDGTIEAVSARDAPIFAVQWHPEYAVQDEVSQAVFSVFAKMMRR